MNTERIVDGLILTTDKLFIPVPITINTKPGGFTFQVDVDKTLSPKHREEYVLKGYHVLINFADTIQPGSEEWFIEQHKN